MIILRLNGKRKFKLTQKGQEMAKFIMVNTLNKKTNVFNIAILNAELFDSICPGNQYADKFPAELRVGSVIFQRESPVLLGENRSLNFAVKETVEELWAMLK
jgi:hypothetical protein